jgi:PII-like signaling protein
MSKDADYKRSYWIAAANGNTELVKTYINDKHFDPLRHKNGALFLAAGNHHLEIVKILLEINTRDITNDAVYHMDAAYDKTAIGRAVSFLLRIPNTIEPHHDRRIMDLWKSIIEKENATVKNGKTLYRGMIGTGKYKYEQIKRIIQYWSDVYTTASVLDTKEQTLDLFMEKILEPEYTRTEGCPCRSCSDHYFMSPRGYVSSISTVQYTPVQSLCFGLCKKDNGSCKQYNCQCHCSICFEKWIEKMGEDSTSLEKSCSKEPIAPPKSIIRKPEKGKTSSSISRVQFTDQPISHSYEKGKTIFFKK